MHPSSRRLLDPVPARPRHAGDVTALSGQPGPVPPTSGPRPTPHYRQSTASSQWIRSTASLHRSETANPPAHARRQSTARRRPARPRECACQAVPRMRHLDRKSKAPPSIAHSRSSRHPAPLIPAGSRTSVNRSRRRSPPHGIGTTAELRSSEPSARPPSLRHVSVFKLIDAALIAPVEGLWQPFAS